MPRPLIAADAASPATTNAAVVYEPDMTNWPASMPVSNWASALASHATAAAGSPITAVPWPVPTVVSFTTRVAVVSGSDGACEIGTHSPSTTASELALSAIVSASVMRQLAIRLSTISSAGATASVAAMTSSAVTPGPRSGARIRNATSGSTRGAQNAVTGTAAPLGSTMLSRM